MNPIRETLGYSHSKWFYGPERVDDLPPNELAFALRLALAECSKLGSSTNDVRFEGAYVLQRETKASAVPIILVFKVATETVARRVHQFVWNQNQSPFLIVESPTTIRVYSGFTYERDGDNSLVSVAKNTANILETLSAFRAESIDNGTLWNKWAHAVDPSNRVDQSLLRDLEKLNVLLQEEGVDRKASHGLIGKFVYLRYLHDRDILSDKKLAKWGIDPDHLFTHKATINAFRKVNDELQTWLNGSVFSLGEAELAHITASQLRLVARVFRGDSLEGKNTIQPSLFDSYDFSHIPIETLSCVYEQFLHDVRELDGRSRGKTLGAYYTPLALADYVLSELESRRPLKPDPKNNDPMKVLDPACGSGAFLVQCYRRLIEKQRRIEGRDLKKTELRDLLTGQIFGVDRDDDACRVAELSLIMTLLDYVQPPDLEDTSFQLPRLRGQNIFGPWVNSENKLCNVDFFDTSGPVYDMLAKQRFAWIVGNPPWAEVKKTPAKDHEHYIAHQWMKIHKKTHPTSGNQIAEAFIWKAGEHLAPDGLCGLVVLSMTWFKKEAIEFRQRFFSQRRVWTLANFANLAYVLFAGRSERPASVVFFEAEKPDDTHIIFTFAPFVAEQIANRPEKPNRRLFTWNIIVSGYDIHEIANADAKLGDSLTWKIAMWGTSRDRKLLKRLDGQFNDTKIDSLKQFGIEDPHQGFELRKVPPQKEGSAEPVTVLPEIELKANAPLPRDLIKPAEDGSGRKKKESLKHYPDLEGKKILEINALRNMGAIFAFPAVAIGTISAENCYIRVRGGLAGLDVSNPPHVIVDASRRFAVFSDEFIAIPPRQVGIAGNSQSETALRALSLYLSSDFFRYHQFFNAPKWGIDESIADLETLKQAPMAIVRMSSAELSEWAEIQRELAAISKRQHEGFGTGKDEQPHLLAILDDLNNRVFKLLGLRPTERWLVEDFVRFQMELIKGKVTNVVRKQPMPDERDVYLVALLHCLDGFLSTDRGLRHKLEVLVDRDSALISVSLVRSKVPVEPITYYADDVASRNLKVIRDDLQSKHSQWVYFDRALKIYKRGVLYQFKPLQRLHWTRRQAVLDADDIIAETLAEGGGS